jgi:hypothetical protein
MRVKLKQSFSFTILAIFLANITGALYLWHTAIENACQKHCDEHEDKHDSDNCPICQNILNNSPKFLNASSATTICINILEYAIDYNSEDPLTIQNTRNIIPRAPPA